MDANNLEIIPEAITVLIVGSGLLSSMYVLRRLMDFEDSKEQIRFFLPVILGMILFLLETVGNAAHTLDSNILGSYAKLWEDVFLLGEAVCFGAFLFQMKKALMPAHPGG
ncbi:MAG: hypothetical protein V1921_04740 [Candidatus Altiarchaeota archaeon]